MKLNVQTFMLLVLTVSSRAETGTVRGVASQKNVTVVNQAKTEDQATRTLTNRVTQTVHGLSETSFKFARWRNDYRFQRAPGLAGFYFDDKRGDFEPDIIGVRNQRHGTNMWFRDNEGEDDFNYYVRSVSLPAGTTYFDKKGYYSGHGNGCASQEVFVSAGNCLVTPVLRGFSVDYSSQRSIAKIKVKAEPLQKPGYCMAKIEACFSDRNSDDPFEYWIYFANVPNSSIERKGNIGDVANWGWDSERHNNACYPRCQGDAVITGFEFRKHGEWWGQSDMHLNRIGVWLTVELNDVKARVWFSDMDEQDDYSWNVQYALVK